MPKMCIHRTLLTKQSGIKKNIAPSHPREKSEGGGGLADVQHLSTVKFDKSKHRPVVDCFVQG